MLLLLLLLRRRRKQVPALYMYVAVNDLACTVARDGRARGGSAVGTLDSAVWKASVSAASVHPVQSSYRAAKD